MSTVALVVLVAATAINVMSPAAMACSCVAMPPEGYLAAVDTVFVGRAHADEEDQSGTLLQRFDVIHVIKGKIKARAVWSRTDQNRDPSACGITYDAGEIVLVFAKEGAVGRCGGNGPLDNQGALLPIYLRAGPQPAKPTPFGAFRAALKRTLPPYLHAPTNVKPHVVYVVYDDFAGKSVFIERSILTFAESDRLRPVVIDRAVSRGNLHYIEGHYDAEGIVFQAMVKRRSRKKYQVLWQRVVEQ